MADLLSTSLSLDVSLVGFHEDLCLDVTLTGQSLWHIYLEISYRSCLMRFISR